MTAPRFSSVLFDWDGCLARTLDVWVDAYGATFARFDRFPTFDEIAAGFGDVYAHRRFGMGPEQDDAYFAVLTEEVATRAEHVALTDGAVPLLRELHAHGVPIAVVTSSMAAPVRATMERTAVDRFVQVLITAEDVVRHKPDPEPLHVALARLGTLAEGAVMIGDSANDVHAAKAAGTGSILFAPEAHRAFYDFDELVATGAGHVCTSFAEIRDLLLVN